MTAKSVLVSPQGLLPGARAPTFPPPLCYATAWICEKLYRKKKNFSIALKIGYI